MYLEYSKCLLQAVWTGETAVKHFFFVWHGSTQVDKPVIQPSKVHNNLYWDVQFKGHRFLDYCEIVKRDAERNRFSWH